MNKELKQPTLEELCRYFWELAKKYALTEQGKKEIASVEFILKSELVGNDITETIGKLHTEIINCLYGYNANDGSIHIVLSGGYEIIVEYNDNRKKWTFITIKAPSENGYYPSEKMAMSKMRVKTHKTKMRNYMNENEHSQRHDNKTRKAKPYKREKFNWREY